MAEAVTAEDGAGGRYAAIVADLDGVLTKTARVHARAWKDAFDPFLSGRAGQAPFQVDRDYRAYVDGKPRYEGVASFLASRGIELPWGAREDDPGDRTLCGLGNLKNHLFRERLRRDGVDVYPLAIQRIKALRCRGLRTAVVSSSENCAAVLEAAGITRLFDARVDGDDLHRCQLRGKPAPDMFLEAARRLECEPRCAIGVEDAMAGVEALSAAGYGLVVGVNHGGQAGALKQHGADLVLADLGDLRLDPRSMEGAASAGEGGGGMSGPDGRESAGTGSPR